MDVVAALLTFASRPRLPIDLTAELARRSARVQDWDRTLYEAECHGLSPLLYQHLRLLDSGPPAEVSGKLQALYIRHRRSSGVLLRALSEILAAFETEGIASRILKGPAVIALVYRDPALRPFGDLDILVARRDASRVAAVLRALGYGAPAGVSRQNPAGHHHLPLLTRWIEGVVVMVEIHHDALATDHGQSLTLDDGRGEPPTTCDIGGRTALTLGPHDLLWHLCLHLAGPLPNPLRLIWFADVLGVAERFADELDWDDLKMRRPIILNMLGLISGLTPLPESISRRVRVPAPGALGAFGRAYPDWSWFPGSRRAAGGRVRQLVRAINPPEWWLRMRYGGLETATVWTQRLRHLPAAGRAVRRRVWSGLTDSSEKSRSPDRG